MGVGSEGEVGVASEEGELGSEEGAGAVGQLKLGVCLWNQAATWPDVLETAKLVDRCGYQHLWTWDHLLSIYGEPDQPVFESWTVLAAAAAVTEKVHLGPLVTANTFRPPALLAKIATTLDHVSGGRAILGIGGGWFELEHRSHGIDFGSGFGERLDRLDEAVGLIKSLFRGETVTSLDGCYPVENLHHEPPPLRGDIPVLIGGRGKRKTLRTVAKYAQIWNAYGTPAELREHDEVLCRHCEEVGRDQAEIERSVQTKLVVRDTQKQAEEDFRRMLAHNKTTLMPRTGRTEPNMKDRNVFPDPDSTIWLGNPEQLAERIASYMAVGFETVIVEIPAPYDRESIERLIGEVAPMLS